MQSGPIGNCTVLVLLYGTSVAKACGKKVFIRSWVYRRQFSRKYRDRLPSTAACPVDAKIISLSGVPSSTKISEQTCLNAMLATEDDLQQHEERLSIGGNSGIRREQLHDGLENQAMREPLPVQDTKAEERIRRPSTSPRRPGEVEETRSMQRARLLELQRLANEKRELEAQLAEVKLLMRVATGGKVCWKAAARDLSPNNPNKRKPARRRRRKRRPSTAPSVERAREVVPTAGDAGKCRPADLRRKADLGGRSERAGKKVGEAPANKETLGGGKRSFERGARETTRRRSDGGDEQGETGRVRQPGVRFGACPLKDRPATVGGGESTFRESTSEGDTIKLQRPASALHRPKSASRQPVARALTGPVGLKTARTGMNPTEEKRYETGGVDVVPTRPMSARRSGLNGPGLGDSDGRSTQGWRGHKRGRWERDDGRQAAVTVSSPRSQNFVASVSTKGTAASKPQNAFDAIDREPSERKGTALVTTPSSEYVADGYEDGFDAISPDSSRVHESNIEPVDNEENCMHAEPGRNQHTTKKYHQRRARKYDGQQLRAMAGGGSRAGGKGGDGRDSFERNSERYHRTTTGNVLRHDESWGDDRENASASGVGGDASSWDQWYRQDGLISANGEWESLRKDSVNRRTKSHINPVDNRPKGAGLEFSSSYDELDIGDATDNGLPNRIEGKGGKVHLGEDANKDEERVSTTLVSEGGSSLYDVLLSSHGSSSDKSWSLESSLPIQSETMGGRIRDELSVSHPRVSEDLNGTIVDGEMPTAVASSSDGSSLYEPLSSSYTASASDEVGRGKDFFSPHPPRVRDFEDALIVAAKTPLSSRGAYQESGSLTSAKGEPHEVVPSDRGTVPADSSGDDIVGDEDGDRVETDRHVIDDHEMFDESSRYDKAHRVLPREGSLDERVSDTRNIVAGAVAGDQRGSGFGESGGDVEGNVENTGSFDEWSPGGHPQQGSFDEGSLDEHASDGQPLRQDATTGRQDVGFSGGRGHTIDDEVENKLSFDELSLVGTTQKKVTGERSVDDLVLGEQSVINCDDNLDQGVGHPGEHARSSRGGSGREDTGLLDEMPSIGNPYEAASLVQELASGDQGFGPARRLSIGRVSEGALENNDSFDKLSFEGTPPLAFLGEGSSNEGLFREQSLVNDSGAGVKGISRRMEYGCSSRSERKHEDSHFSDGVSPDAQLHRGSVDDGFFVERSKQIAVDGGVGRMIERGLVVENDTRKGGLSDEIYLEDPPNRVSLEEEPIDGHLHDKRQRTEEVRADHRRGVGHAESRDRAKEDKLDAEEESFGGLLLHDKPRVASLRDGSVDEGSRDEPPLLAGVSFAEQGVNGMGNRGRGTRGEHGNKRLFDGNSVDDRRDRKAVNGGSLNQRLRGSGSLQERAPVEDFSGDQDTSHLGESRGPVIQDELENRRLFEESSLDKELHPDWPDEGSRGKRLLDKGLVDQRPRVGEATAGDQGVDHAGRRFDPREDFVENRESFDELSLEGKLRGESLDQGARATDQDGAPVGGDGTGHEGDMKQTEPPDESSLEEVEPQRDALDLGRSSDKKRYVYDQQPAEQTKLRQDLQHLDDGDSFDGNSLGIRSTDDAGEESGNNSKQPTPQDGSLDEYLYDNNSFEELSFDDSGSMPLDGGDVETLDDNELSADGYSSFDEQSLGGHYFGDSESLDEQSL